MHLFLDLDGTLTDSFIGICRCVIHALAELGRDSVPEPQLRGMVGAPLTTIFAVLLASDQAALLDRAVWLVNRFLSVAVAQPSQALDPAVAASNHTALRLAPIVSQIV